MSELQHARPASLDGLALAEIAHRHTALFRDRVADWQAFPDARIDGYHRAQHRFIAVPGEGKQDPYNVIPAGAFTLSVLYVPPGQGNPPHTHGVEEVLFVLQGYLSAFLADESGELVTVKLGPWDCLSCPPGVVHGYRNEGIEPVYVQALLGRARPDLYPRPDHTLLERRDVELPEQGRK